MKSKIVCSRCLGTGLFFDRNWNIPIDSKEQEYAITPIPCPKCHGENKIFEIVGEM